MKVTRAVPSTPGEGSECMHTACLQLPAHTRRLSAALWRRKLTPSWRLGQGLWITYVSHCNLVWFSACVFKDFITTLEHSVSHVHNVSESAVRKRIVTRKRMIFLSKRKMWWGCFSTIIKSAILNHMERKRTRKKKGCETECKYYILKSKSKHQVINTFIHYIPCYCLMPVSRK